MVERVVRGRHLIPFIVGLGIFWIANAEAANEQRCNELGANCTCSEQLNTPTYTEVQNNAYWDPADSTTKQCSLQPSLPGAWFEYDHWPFQVATSGEMFNALPSRDTSIQYLLRSKTGEGGAFQGHQFSNSAPTGRISLRWYQYFSPTYQFTSGACDNSAKIVELFNSAGQVILVFSESPGVGVHSIYGWGTAWNIGGGSGFDCCVFGPGPNNGQVPYNASTMNGKWWRFEVAIDNPLSSGGTTVIKFWRKNITNNLAEELVLDTSIPTNQPLGVGANWSSTQASTLKPDSRIQRIVNSPWRNGSCSGYVGFTHYLAAAWATPAGQRIGAANEIEGGLPAPSNLRVGMLMEDE